LAHLYLVGQDITLKKR